MLDQGRRNFITLLGGAAAWPMAARAQPSGLPVIGFLDVRTPDVIEERLRAYRRGLKEAGYVESENLSILYRFAEGQADRLPLLARELVERRVVAIGTAGDEVAVAAKAAAPTTESSRREYLIDPINQGPRAYLVHICFPEKTKRLAIFLRQDVVQPTRISAFAADLEPKRFGLLPQAPTLGVLLNRWIVALSLSAAEVLD
jgi:hypothetical protein